MGSMRQNSHVIFIHKIRLLRCCSPLNPQIRQMADFVGYIFTRFKDEFLNTPLNLWKEIS